MKAISFKALVQEELTRLRIELRARELKRREPSKHPHAYRRHEAVASI